MRYAVILIPLFLLVLPARAQESLSREISVEYLDKLIAISKANYPKVKMFESRVSAADNAIKKARLSYFDIFNFSYLYSPTNNTTTISPTFLAGYQFGFFVNIGGLLQKPNLIRQAKSEKAAAQFDKDANDLSLEAEIKKRYYTYVQKKMVYRVRTSAVLDVESMLANVKHRFENGQESLEKYNQILIMQTDHVQNLISSESEMLVAKASLEELLGQKLEDIK